MKQEEENNDLELDGFDFGDLGNMGDINIDNLNLDELNEEE